MHSSDSAGEATEFLGQAPGGGGGATLSAGARCGDYVIRRMLGEGGMGCVYLAEQIRPVRREVALKLIREQVASPFARAWFDVERQALAQMQHPAIAQVFDAGTTAEGHPYLAMELVEGCPITQFCRDERLGLDARLALFVRVCHGVQHAHQKGIIHRDLKPANVLVRRVDGEPMPTIIDFGIAIGGCAGTSERPAVSAASADQAGTAIYMSPEQADRRGRDLDTRSDVYALGVMLYEVLTGGDAAALASSVRRSVRAPQHGLLVALDAATDAAAPADATSPSAALLLAAQRLPMELRAVLRKALAVERADRYDSAAALADDLERYRERRPVKALPWTRAYLTRIFVARHRLGLAAATMVALALLVGIALALHGLTRAQQAAQEARIEAAKAAQIAGFVQDMLAGIDPDRAKGMDNRLLRLVLDSAAERAGRELAAQPATRAAIERTIAASYASLGEYALALAHVDAALAAAADLPAGERARLQMRRADTLVNLGRLPDALRAGAAAQATVAALSPDDRDRLYVESRLAWLDGDAGRLEASREGFLRALALQRRAFGDDDEDTLSTLEGLAITDSNLARYDEARALYERLIAQRRARHGDEHSRTFGAINGLAVLELEQKHFAAAEALLVPQLPLYERVYGADHPITLRVVSNLGSAIRQQGRNEEARPYYERAFALAQELYGARNPATLFAEINLAALLRDAGELAPAEQHARAAVAGADAVLGDNPFRAIFHKELATVLIREQRYAEAEHALDRAWGIFAGAKDFGPTHPRRQEVVDAYVELYTAWNKPDRAALWRGRRTPAVTAAEPGR